MGDDDARSFCTIVPHELECVEEEDKEQIARQEITQINWSLIKYILCQGHCVGQLVKFLQAALCNSWCYPDELSW